MSGDGGHAKSPADDFDFERLVSRWTDGSLGFDKDEGVGLLWKEGYISDFLGALHRRAPATMAALGKRLAEGAPPFAEDTGYIPQRLIAEFVDTMKLPRAARRERFGALDLGEPFQDLPEAFAALEPPMDRKLRVAIEAWMEAAGAIEARLTSPPVSASGFVVGGKARHAKWGEGLVVAVTPGDDPTLTLDFGAHGEKKLKASFVKPAR